MVKRSFRGEVVSWWRVDGGRSPEQALQAPKPCHPGQAGVLDGSATIRWGGTAWPGIQSF